MKFHEQYLSAYRAFFGREHSFSATHLGIMAIMATDTKRQFKARELAYMLCVSELTARKALKRLETLEYVENGRLLPWGETIMGLRDPHRYLKPFPVYPPQGGEQADSGAADQDIGRMF